LITGIDSSVLDGVVRGGEDIGKIKGFLIGDAIWDL